MRRLVTIGLVLAALWCLWWFGASALLRMGTDHWLEARRGDGWQAEVAGVEGGGFPTLLVARLIEPRLADPSTGVAVATTQLEIEADAWRPMRARVRLPNAPIYLAAPDRRATLEMEDGVMRMDLRGLSDMRIDTLSWTSGPWRVDRPRGQMLGAHSLVLSKVAEPETEATYRYAVDMAGVQPGELLRRQWRIPSDWPVEFETFSVDMSVTFDRAWDRRALEDRRPQPRQITLRLAEAAWGDMRLRFAADLDVDAAGVPEGSLRVQAENWNEILWLAEQADVLPGGMAQQLEGLIGRFAEASGNPETLDVTFKMSGGRMFIGILPVGPAPRIGLR